MKRSNENYQEKTKSFSESFTSTGDLKTRYDALFEHHKYLKGKKQVNDETKKEKVPLRRRSSEVFKYHLLGTC